MPFALTILALLIAGAGIVFNIVWHLDLWVDHALLTPAFGVLNNAQTNEILFLLLFFPLFSIPIVILRHIVGIKTYGTFVPLVIGFTLVEEGFWAALLSYILLIVLGILGDRVLQSANILSTARKSLNLFFLGMWAALLYVMFIAYNIPVGFLGVPFIIMVHVLEQFNRISSDKGEWYATQLFINTLLVAVFVYWLSQHVRIELSPPVMVTLFCVSFCANIILSLYTGPRLTEFWRFRFMLFQGDSDSGSGFMGMNFRNVKRVEALNSTASKELANDKVAFKQVLNEQGIPTTKLLAVVKSSAAVNIKETLQRTPTPFVLKPARGAAGRGILIIESVTDDVYFDIKGREWPLNDLVRYVQEIVKGTYSLASEDESGDVCMIEEKLVPPEFFIALSETGLADVRVIYDQLEPIAAMLRLPTIKSAGKANISQGALGAAVNLETGKIEQVYGKKGYKRKHPAIGQFMPQWNEVLEIGAKAVAAAGLGYGGVDIVYDQTIGPIIMEVNASPGLEIQNVTGINLRKA